jgi:predicted nucleotidyltransferase
MSTVLDYRECLDGLRRIDRLPSSYLSVYAGGSRVRGWGNAGSDLDIFVITTSPWTSETAQYEPVALQPGRIMIEATYIDDLRWDIEYWLDSQVDELFEKVSADQLAGVQPAGQHLTETEVCFLQKLSHSAPIDKDGWWEARRRRLAESPVSSIMALRSLHRLDIYTEDLAGQLASGDVDSAVLTTKVAWTYAIEAMLAAHGEFGAHPKWFVHLFRSLEPMEITFDEFWAVETMRTFDPGTPTEWIEEVIGLCQRISSEVNL